MFSKLLSHYPAHSIVGKPTPDFIDRYRALVPPELSEVWEQFGFGTVCEGYLKIVNPEDYTDLLVWERGYLVLVAYRYGKTEVVAKNLRLFFRSLTEEDYLAEQLRWEPYPAARARLGELAFDECFGYVPLLALGGPETVDHLQKVKLREHLYLISQVTGVLER